jgi:hypothetical protein
VLEQPSDVGAPCAVTFVADDCDASGTSCFQKDSPSCQELCVGFDGVAPYCTQACDQNADPTCPVGFVCSGLATLHNLQTVCRPASDLGSELAGSYVSAQCDGVPICAFQPPNGQCVDNITVRISDSTGYCSARCSKLIGCPSGYTCESAPLVNSYLQTSAELCVRSSP